MSSRAATREYSHFLVKYDDDTLYTCGRVKIITEGRVRVGERYEVVYGTSTNNNEYATVIDTGDYLQMKNKEAELRDAQYSPSNSAPASPASSESPDQSPTFRIRKRKRAAVKANETKKARPEAKLLSIEEGVNDPYEFRSPSQSPQLPEYLSAPTPSTSPLQSQL